MKKFRLLLLFLLVACLATAGWLYRDWQGLMTSPLIEDGQVVLWLPAGSSFGSLGRQLETLDLGQRDWRWQLYGRLQQPHLRAGEYLLEGPLSLPELVAVLERGQVRRHRFTVVEGWTLARLRQSLASDPRLRQLTTDWDEARLMAELGCDGCFGEGRFLPETYFFVRPDSDLDLLRRAHQALNDQLQAVWQSRAPGLPLQTAEELLVLASIIERETGQAGERAKVAGVFRRRLEIGMRLQTDPTVIYGMGEDFDGRLLRVHLRQDHPWNTYTRHGLPPTPIALPGRASLQAAGHPADGSSLYFVARGDGSHHFSDTLAEHNAAVNRYIRGRR